jgi:hypothetical protein
MSQRELVGRLARLAAYGPIASALAIILQYQVCSIMGWLDSPWQLVIALVIGVCCGLSAGFLAEATTPHAT